MGADNVRPKPTQEYRDGTAQLALCIVEADRQGWKTMPALVYGREAPPAFRNLVRLSEELLLVQREFAEERCALVGAEDAAEAAIQDLTCLVQALRIDLEEILERTPWWRVGLRRGTRAALAHIARVLGDGPDGVVARMRAEEAVDS